VPSNYIVSIIHLFGEEGGKAGVIPIPPDPLFGGNKARELEAYERASSLLSPLFTGIV
jgi:hypothetical protein